MRKLFVGFWVVFFSTAVVNSMGDGVSKGQGSSTLEPSFVEPVEGQGLFQAVLYDEKVGVNLSKFSFSGHTSINGLRREDDDSITTINLADCKEIIIKQQEYQSKRYPDKDFILINLVTKGGKELEGFLAPRNIVVCGIEKETNAKKAWFLKKLDRIVLTQGNDESSESVNFVSKIFKKEPLSKQSSPEQKNQQQEKTSTQVMSQPNLLDQTMTSTANQVNVTGSITVDQQPIGQKTIGQAFMGLLGGIKDLIKAFMNALKKVFKWFV